MKTPSKGRQYWVWVTRPEYYLDEDGNERDDLDPGKRTDTEGWWTCHKDTQRGDLVFLWRTRPKRDIGYLMQAGSDAFSICQDPYARKNRWDYGCKYVVLYRFSHPVSIEDLNQNPYVQDWGAYRANFQQRAYRIPPESWLQINRIAMTKNRGYRSFLRKTERGGACEEIVLEEQLEDALVKNLGLLRRFGYNLVLWKDPESGESGRQLVCPSTRGRIDLLCIDPQRQRYVVVELKNVRAGQNTFGQICGYMGWVREELAGPASVEGLVISRGVDTSFESCVRTNPLVRHVDVDDLDLP